VRLDEEFDHIRRLRAAPVQHDLSDADIVRLAALRLHKQLEGDETTRRERASFTRPSGRMCLRPVGWSGGRQMDGGPPFNRGEPVPTLSGRLFEWEDPPPVVLHIDNCPTLRFGLIECLVKLPDGRGAIIGKFSNCVVVVDK
jgi:hypothetical protein